MASFIDPFAISAYVVYQKAEDIRYLLLKRCSPYLWGTWQMISGGIEPGETAWQAALREIREETGLIPTHFYSADTVETFYFAAKDKIAFVPVFIGFVSSLTDVRLSPNEHDAYAWLTFKEAQERLVWSEQKRVIKHIHKNFVLHSPHPLHLISSNKMSCENAS